MEREGLIDDAQGEREVMEEWSGGGEREGD